MDNIIEKILKSDEKITVEFKEGKDKIPLSLFETYSAFGNTKGGTIYLGIKENVVPPHTIVGVDNAKQKRKNLFDLFNNKEKVSSCLVNEEDVNIIPTPNGDIISIYVHEASRFDKPVYINGDISKSYMRNDSGDYLLSQDKIQSLINDKSELRYDQRPNSLGLKTSDLDQESLDQFVQLIIKTGKISLVNKLDTETILRRAGAIVRKPETGEYVLNNGAIMFLGKTPDINIICPNLWLDYSYSIEGDSRWSKRITNKDLMFEGNIFQFFIRSLEELSAHSPSPFILENGQETGKEKITAILREAFANAISNLDLFEQRGLVIKQTEKDVVFMNSGTMIVPLAEALLGGDSKPRNQTIFSFFQALGISDHGGYGIPFIFDQTKELGYIPPVLEEDKVNNLTTLRISYRKKQFDLSKEEQIILDTLSHYSDGLSILEISEKTSLGRDKTRRLVESLASLKIIQSNNKSTKGKKYFVI